MKNRFHLPATYVPGETLELSGAEFHHAAKVARVRVGENVEIFDGVGCAATATVESILADRAILLVKDEEVPSRESAFNLILAMSLIHHEKFELVLQKGTELGAHSFIPLMADRSEVRIERIRGRNERWMRILLEAVKQSGRSRIPELCETRTVAQALEGAGPHLMFEAEAAGGSMSPESSGATIFIGPEGGWSAEELEQARLRGAIFRRLGPRRLRAETAAIAALTTIGTELGDLAR
jgi:16S rRNA (uracil1498-N3)-methyltransferase